MPTDNFSPIWRCFLLWLSNAFLFLWWLDEWNKADICHCFHSQAHDYIIAGGCLAVGFRFAGSANSDAFDCLVSGRLLPPYSFEIFLNVLNVFFLHQYKFARNFMQCLTTSTATVVSICLHWRQTSSCNHKYLFTQRPVSSRQGSITCRRV